MARSKDVSRVVSLLLLAAVSFAFIQAASARLHRIKSEEKFKPVDVVASNLLEFQITLDFEGLTNYLVDNGNRVFATIDPIFSPGFQSTLWRVEKSRGSPERFAFALRNVLTGNNLFYDVDQERFYGEKIQTAEYLANWELLQSEEDPRRFKLRVLPEQVDAKLAESDEPGIFHIRPSPSSYKSYHLV